MNSSAYEAAVLAKMPFKTLTNVSNDPNCVEPSYGGYKVCCKDRRCCIHCESATYDPNITANSGRVVQSCLEAKHKQLIEDHMIEKAVLQVAKNQLQEALLKWLLSEIEDRNTGLNTVSLQDIFNHVYNCGGHIGNDLVDEYTSNFNAPIDMSQGFNTYARHQEECRDFFSDVQQPITDQQLAGKGQLHIGQTGIC
eukprot:12249234-Ditylum_brightwellii.AAC.1